MCNFKILWGDSDIVGVQDQESWFDAIQISENLKQSGAWYSLVHEDGTEEKFQRAHWLTKLQDEKFKKRVLQIMDDDVIMKFSNKTGKASDFYDHEEILPQTDEQIVGPPLAHARGVFLLGEEVEKIDDC